MSSKPAGFSRPIGTAGKDEKKPPESGGSSTFPGDRRAARSEPLRAFPVTMVPARAAVTIVAAITVAKAVVPPALAVPAHMRQDGKATFLAFIEGLVERVSRVSDLLQRCRRGRHSVGAFAQARHRILRLLLIRIIPRRVHPRIGAIDPHFREIPHRR